MKKPLTLEHFTVCSESDRPSWIPWGNLREVLGDEFPKLEEFLFLRQRAPDGPYVHDVAEWLRRRAAQPGSQP